MRFSMQHSLASFVLLVATFVAAGSVAKLNAQSISGRTVTSSGIGVPHARVVAENLTTHETLFSICGDDGQFVLTHLKSGSYRIAASAAGFSGTSRVISLIGNQTISVVLQIVSATPNANQSNSPNSVSSTTISDLPLNGRSASDVATLEPGVATARTQTSGEAQRGFGTQMT